jgi:hypothetical protein
MPALKLILASKKRLKEKYGPDFKQLQQLLREWMAADTAKGLRARLIYIDEAASLRSLQAAGGCPV